MHLGSRLRVSGQVYVTESDTTPNKRVALTDAAGLARLCRQLTRGVGYLGAMSRARVSRSCTGTLRAMQMDLSRASRVV